MFPRQGITKGSSRPTTSRCAADPAAPVRPTADDGALPPGIGAEGILAEGRLEGFPSGCSAFDIPRKTAFVNYPVIHRSALADSVVTKSQKPRIHAAHMEFAGLPDLNYPDLCVFDLDPSKDDVKSVQGAAVGLRDLLAELGLPSWVKTTGSKGFHIAVPIDGKTPMGTVVRFANAVGAFFVTLAPTQLTQEFSKVDRRGRIYVDTGRNGFSATFAAAYHVPWRDLNAPVSARAMGGDRARQDQTDTFTITNMPPESPRSATYGRTCANAATP